MSQVTLVLPTIMTDESGSLHAPTQSKSSYLKILKIWDRKINAQTDTKILLPLIQS
jgi:hypothetical protein